MTRFQRTYEELKRGGMHLWNKYTQCFQRTYEELKPCVILSITFHQPPSFQRTYEELKPEVVFFVGLYFFVFSVPMRN